MSGIREQLIEIARRKERLIARAELQRAAIAVSVQQLQGPIAVVDRGLKIARFLREHPLLVAVVIGVATVFRGRSLLSLAGRGLAAWRLWRSLSAWSAGPLR